MPMYALRISWAWDKLHTDWVTLSLEELDLNSKPIHNLEDPNCPEEHKTFVFDRFKRIAELQNGCAMGGPRLVAVYRVLYTSRDDELPDCKDGSGLLSFQLKLIFRFDEKGNPVPVT